MKNRIILFLFLFLSIIGLYFIFKNPFPLEKTLRGDLERYQPLRKYNYILGPISLTYHTHPSFPQKIYVFGDRHIKGVKCPPGVKINKDNAIPLVNFLVELTQLKNIASLDSRREDKNGTDKKIDYFFEIAYNQKFNPRDFIFRGYLKDIYQQFKNCLSISKEDCEFKNVRIHYSDARFGFQEIQILEDFYKILIDWDITPKMSLRDPEVLSFWEGLTILFSNPEIILESNKINKQIESLEEPIKSRIESFKKPVLYLLKTLNNGKEKIIYNFNLNPEDRNEDEIRGYLKRYSIALQRLMDLYLFSRLFRNFEKEKGRFAGQPENIVIYSGELHSEVYRNWLDILGFRKESESYSNQKDFDFQCLDISSFKQPFFS